MLPPDEWLNSDDPRELGSYIRKCHYRLKKEPHSQKFPGTDKTIAEKVKEITGDETGVSQIARLVTGNFGPSLVTYKTYLRNLFRTFPFIVDKANEISLKQEDTQDELLEELAAKLALNLIDVSTSLDEENILYQNILTDRQIWEHRIKDDRNHRERFIGIAGAGASNAATAYANKENCIPNAKEAHHIIRENITHDILEELFQNEQKRLDYYTRGGIEDFERAMMTMAKFVPDKVLKELELLCGNRYVPTLVYEVLAHLLKHRFLDVIINFNYDELLDTAIEEEIPDNEYKFIYSGGHCPDNLQSLKIDSRIKQPIYIKCQGTISRPNSLRFTDEKSFLIEDAIVKHIKELIKGEINEGRKDECLPINLIVFGFSMRNELFNQIIKDKLKENSSKITIWLFDTNDQFKKQVSNLFINETEKKPNDLEIKFIRLKDIGAMNDILLKLWEKIVSCFEVPYKPKGISRHQFVNRIFKGISPRDFYQDGYLDTDFARDYYKDRFHVELAILLLESNGIIHTSQLSGNRAGRYFEKYWELNEEANTHTYLNDFGLAPFEDFMYDTFLLKKKKLLQDKRKAQDFILKKLRDVLSGPRKANMRGEAFNEISDYAKGVRSRRLLMVNPKYSGVHDYLFSSIKKQHIMNTSLAWIYNYRKNIEIDLEKWDLMLTVTEEGGFLNYDLDSETFSHKQFEVILASYDSTTPEYIAQKPVGKMTNLLSKRLLYRPWWLHNKHMVILLNKDDDTGNWRKDWTIRQGYYYSHRMLSRRVNPIKLTNTDDLKRLFFIFITYWQGALNYNPRVKTQQSMGILSSKDELDQLITRLLGLYKI